MLYEENTASKGFIEGILDLYFIKTHYVFCFYFFEFKFSFIVNSNKCTRQIEIEKTVFPVWWSRHGRCGTVSQVAGGAGVTHNAGCFAGEAGSIDVQEGGWDADDPTSSIHCALQGLKVGCSAAPIH